MRGHPSLWFAQTAPLRRRNRRTPEAEKLKRGSIGLKEIHGSWGELKFCAFVSDIIARTLSSEISNGAR